RSIHPTYFRPARCRLCYRLRLTRTAQRAAEMGCSAFTTTMVASQHQDHELLRAEAEAAAAAAGVAFLYRDFRAAAPEVRLIRALYRQQYCGCIFSEAERYSGEK
ncbi:MAG: epoxyqueuosine reductase QueH, partial [Planctomycetota bacterium]|nr:epoxyqueuosine reductase QueH [Planctomycetota bacterium]